MSEDIKTVVSPVVDDAGVDKPVKLGKAEKKGGKRIGYNYIVIKSLKESQKNDVVKCWYMKSLLDFGFCVIKEGTSGDSKDKQGRDIRDRLIWQKELHGMLQHKVRMPKLLGSFEENGNFYLVMERLKGEPMNKVFKNEWRQIRAGLLSGDKTGIRFLGYLLQIVGILHVLHQQGIVHRDATLNNFMVLPGGKVAVIDMELSYSINTAYPSPPFQLGTIGYMSPEQEAVSIPTSKEDVFSIGAIMLQLWTGISPHKLLPVNLDRVRMLVPDQGFADMISRMMDADAVSRPDMSEVRAFLTAYRADMQRKSHRPLSPRQVVSRDQILEVVQQGIETLGGPVFADPERGWFAEDMGKPSEDKNKINKTFYASFNRGVGGIIYFLARAGALGFDISATKSALEAGFLLIKNKYIDREERNTPGLHYGSDGVAVAIATAIDLGLLQNGGFYKDAIQQLLVHRTGTHGMVGGIAGQGIANMLSAAHLPADVLYSRLLAYAEELIGQQAKTGAWYANFAKKRVIPGFGAGAAGIICYLLEFGSKYNHQRSLAAAEDGLHWLMGALKDQEWVSHSGKQLAYSLYDGVPGILLAFARGYHHLQQNSYREVIDNVWRKRVTIQNSYGQASGMAGVNEVNMELAAIFQQEPFFMEAASNLAQLLTVLRSRKSNNPLVWFVESERVPVGNFMIGNAGVLHMLMRYVHPGKVSVPLLPALF